MTTRQKLLIIIPILIAVGIVGGILIKSQIGPIRIPGTEDQPVTTNAVGELVQFLNVPDGFKATYYAKDVPGARVMLWDSRGRMLVSQTNEGTISLLEDRDSDGAAESVTTLKSGLNHPHGMVFDCTTGSCELYVAEATKLTRYVYDPENPTLGQGEKLLDFQYSAADRHKTRSLLFWNEDLLLISVGSTCNVCIEKGTQHGKILAYDTNTGTVSDFATGLRNAVFMTKSFVTGELWMTEMGRDGLGDDIPPDEVNVVRHPSSSSGQNLSHVPNFGWPICYGKNIHDTNFDKNTYIRNPCMEPFETPSFIDIPAHSAPLGLSFIPEEGWPESDWYDLLVAYHGSWNRSTPTGYKIVRMKLDAKGNSYSGTEDFITGWLGQDGKKFGRPADVMAMPGGTIYISDDEAGVIYKVSRISE